MPASAVMSVDTKQKTIALVLAGGVARGAFEAGVLKVLADTDLRVVRIVAASSGALNGTYFASAIRARRPREGAQEIVDLWRDSGGWSDVFRLNLLDILHRRGFSDTSRIRSLLRRSIRPVVSADPAPINLRVIVAPVEGIIGSIGDRPASTYEHMLEFDGVDFDSAAGLERVFTAAIASSSLPILFTPTHVPGLGDCVDGGAVNNTPIEYALDDPLGQAIDAAIVISPTVALQRFSTRHLHGTRLIGQYIEMLINERLYRDLRHAEQVNATLARLEALQLGEGPLAAVKQALGPGHARRLEVVTIRPLEPLPGTTFSGFVRRAQREAYIDIGISRAEQVLRELGWR